MKTKFIWSEEDVQCGMIVCRRNPRKGPFKPCGWTAKWTHKIGFVPGDGKIEPNPSGRGFLPSAQYCQIAMTDGMVYHRGLSKKQMAERLTQEDMIPMPYSWWLKTCRLLQRQTCPKTSLT